MAKTGPLTFLLRRQRSNIVSVYLWCRLIMVSMLAASDMFSSNSIPTQCRICSCGNRMDLYIHPYSRNRERGRERGRETYSGHEVVGQIINKVKQSSSQ